LVQEYIKPAVAWRAASEVVVASSYQITNKGTQIQSGDFSSSPPNIERLCSLITMHQIELVFTKMYC
jgi:hypothetical protein